MQRELDSKRKVMENEIAAIRERFAREEQEMKILIGQDITREKTAAKTMKEIATRRRAER